MGLAGEVVIHSGGMGEEEGGMRESEEEEGEMDRVKQRHDRLI